MSLGTALDAAVRALRRPAELLPVYLLGPAVPAVARLGLLGGLGVAWLHLEATGRLDAVLADLGSRQLTPPDPEQTEAFADWAAELAPVVEPLLTPTVAAALFAGLVATLVLAIVLAAAVSAAQLATCAGLLSGEPGLTAGIAGMARSWRVILAAYLLEGLVWVVATVVLLVVAAVAGALSPLVALVVVPMVGLVWLAVVLGTRLVFVFVPVAVVVDESPLLPAVGATMGFLRSRPGEAGGYLAIALGTFVAVGVLAGVLALLRIEALLAPIGFLAVAPALDLVKTGVFVEHRGSLSPPPTPDRSPRAQLVGGLRRGLSAVGGFVRGAPGAHVLAVGALLLGLGAGWVAAEPLVGALETSILDRLADHVPPAAAVNFFGNNWGVAISIGMGGLALVLPALAGLWVNGLALGLVARLEVAPAVLFAFVLPHGVLELPALVVAGALGVTLGRRAWRTWRGRASVAALADALERAFWVLVGLGVVLGVAGLIEGFVSPYYWRPFLPV